MNTYKILQLNKEHENENIFLSWDDVKDRFTLGNYDVVYEGEICGNNYYEILDELYEIFNLYHPKDFKGRSLSVSDVVVLNGINWYCDSFGWVNIDEKLKSTKTEVPNMKDYIANELMCLRASEPIGSDRYNELSKAIQWVNEQEEKGKDKEAKKEKSAYAHTTIEWKEDGRREEAIIAVNCPYIEKYDEAILFYCESEEEFEHLKEHNNGEDFVVVGCTMFTESIY